VVDLEKKIINAIAKFNLNLTGKIILTEAATGNYVVTPLIAALAGAEKVYAFTKTSRYGTIEQVKKETYHLAQALHIQDRIEVITDLEQISLDQINILTNTGFLRPITETIIKLLSSNCVIPLMWETWEYRESDLDLNACLNQNIKVYGTNEDDQRLNTKEYIGYMGLKFLLQLNHTPLSSRVLILGCEYFTIHLEKILKRNQYELQIVNVYHEAIDVTKFDVIILLEHHNDLLLIGENGYINIHDINETVDVIHICGNVDFTLAKFNHIPAEPSPFGYMSYTADYMGAHVVIDLHTASLKVAEGMLQANNKYLTKEEYKMFMETNYPAMSFQDERYW